MNSKKNIPPVYIDKEECIGCETCSTFYQELFAMKDDKASFIGKNKSFSKSEVSEIISSCPVGAIKASSDED